MGPNHQSQIPNQVPGKSPKKKEPWKPELPGKILGKGGPRIINSPFKGMEERNEGKALGGNGKNVWKVQPLGPGPTNNPGRIRLSNKDLGKTS